MHKTDDSPANEGLRTLGLQCRELARRLAHQRAAAEAGLLVMTPFKFALL